MTELGRKKGREERRTEKMKHALSFPINIDGQTVICLLIHPSIHVATSFTHVCKSFNVFTQEGHTKHSSGLRDKIMSPSAFSKFSTQGKHRGSALETGLHSMTEINGPTDSWELCTPKECPGHNAIYIYFLIF